MTTKAATANGAGKEVAKYSALIDKDLVEIKEICKDMARKRAEGRKVTARIDRNLKGIQAIINRVAATVGVQGSRTTLKPTMRKAWKEGHAPDLA